MVYLRKPASYVLPIAFAIYVILMFPVFREIIFVFDSFYNVWRARKIVEAPMSIFRPEFMGRFGPLYTLFFFLMDRFFGFNPWAYALLNGLLHLLNAFLLFRLVRRLFGPSQIPALLTSLVFLFSSTQWGVFLDTSQTARLVCASLYLSSLLFFLKFTVTRKKRHWAFSFFLFITSFGFIEDAVTLPLLLLAILFLIPPRPVPFTRKLILTGPFFFVSLMYGGLSFSFGGPQGWGLRIGPHMLVNLLFLIRELTQLLLIPRREFVPLSGMPGILLRLVPAFLVLSFAGFLWSWKKNQILTPALQPFVVRILIFGIAWVAITASIYSLRPMKGVWPGRYLYLPGMGGAIVVGVILYLVGKWLRATNADPRIPVGIQGILRGGFAGIVLYGLVLNVSTTFLMVGKARTDIRAVRREEIPVAFSLMSAMRDYFRNPFEIPPHTILMVEGLPFSIPRLRELLLIYYAAVPSMIIEARQGHPLKDFSVEENQQILYLKWEDQKLAVIPIRE